MWKPVEQIKKALIELNGVGKLDEIYDRCPNYSDSYLRKVIQSYSSDSNTYPKYKDLFFSVNGIGKGVWGLRNFFPQIENNMSLENNPIRGLSLQNRIVRDTALVKEIKKMVANKCQLCNLYFKLPNGKFYIEGHHIKPLGQPYNGPDSADNILIVCPNCHIKCDYKLIELNLNSIMNNKQNISQKYIDFHNYEYKVHYL
ncbi:MAG: HNH endonuclease [Chitinophagales bacterium]